MTGVPLKSFMPDIVSQNNKLTTINQSINSGFMDTLKSRYGSNVQSAVQFYGIEQLYFDWLRTAYSYRRMFIQDLYLLAFDSAEIRTPLIWLKNEVFRKGFDSWLPRFEVKCEKCGKEYKEKVTACDECGSVSFREPDKSQVEDFDKLKLKCNIFGQSLEEVLRTTLDDVNIVDDAYILLNKQYGKFAGKTYSKVIEIRRLHPALIEFDLDKSGLPKNSHWLCPFHRDQIDAKPGPCPLCHMEMKPIMYIYNHRGLKVYLLEDELLHFSKFSPSETYGYSPLLTVMQKVLTISGMDRYLYRYFFERKTPTQMIMTTTDDPQSLEVERARIESKMMEDPTYTPWVAVSQKNGRGRTDVVKLWHTLQEMDYLPVRNEIRDRISAVYGVPQMYMNVMEGVGGISGQTQQLKVFSSVIQSDQRMFNQKIFPQLLESFGITDWMIHLRPPEEKIEGEILTLAQQKVAIAMQMQQLGFDIKLKPECKDIDTLDFSFSGTAINPMKQQEQMGQQQLAQGEQQLAQGGQQMAQTDQALEAGNMQLEGGVQPGQEGPQGQEQPPSGPPQPPTKEGAVGPEGAENIPEPTLNAGQAILPNEEKVFNNNAEGNPHQKTYEEDVFNTK
jgi:hypothetical protein